jgi:hypothetical protein
MRAGAVPCTLPTRYEVYMYSCACARAKSWSPDRGRSAQ